LSQIETVDSTVIATTANNANVSLTNDCVLAPFFKTSFIRYSVSYDAARFDFKWLNGMALNIKATVNFCVTPMMLDSSTDVSVAALDIIKNLDPVITIPSSGR